MILDIQHWMEQFTEQAKNLFKNRLLFVGLQGSYGRGEAKETSDIDAVLILDELFTEDLYRYDQLLSRLPEREKACGFIAGRRELQNWDRGDLFQFYYDTVPYYGNLEAICGIPGLEEANQAVLTGACTIFHACCHDLVHEKEFAVLRELYKAAVFVLQAKHFCESGQYVKSHTALAACLQKEDADILKQANAVKICPPEGESALFPLAGEQLFHWSKRLIAEYGKKQKGMFYETDSH